MADLGLEDLDLSLIRWPAPSAGMSVGTWKALIELSLTEDEVAQISALHKGEDGRRGKHPAEFAGHQGA
ncbi:hypothetical protein [Brachybacterium vulturis]|uniref:hypothetical protein n=1 Tax=Brachybacterium vulturis TaxID=2017484 RepID=UPI0015B14216|nr:hypothetical protein [Brachybacterium vulturis]